MYSSQIARCGAGLVSALALCIPPVAAQSFSAYPWSEKELVGTGPSSSTEDFPITQSSSLVPIVGSISCSVSSVTAENSYYRTFNLAAFGITQNYTITSLDLGIELAQAGSGGSQPIQVRYYSDNDTNPANGLVSLGPAIVLNLPNSTLNVINIPGGPANVVPSGNLVVEVFIPDAIGPPNLGHQFFIGSNGAGQTGPSYIRAPACGASSPVTTASLGFPNMHIIMRVNGFQIPEPSGLMMGILGLTGWGFSRRRA